MRGATVNTLHPHQILRLPRKMNVMIDPHRIWNLIYTAGSNKHQPPTSPNTAPATQHESHDWSASHMKRHFQCAEQQASPSNLTKDCACHAKWISWFIRITYETSFTMRGATGITLQSHQRLHLPRKIAIQNLREICWKRLRRHVTWRTIRAWSEHDPSMKLQNWTRPFAEVTFPPSATHFVLNIEKYNMSRAPAIYQDFTKCCACQEKWHSVITKYCTCHAKWHCHITKYCACHKKGHSDITKCCACHAKRLSWLILLTYETSFTMRGATKVTLQCYLAELLLYWAVILLSWYLTELLLDWAVTLLSCYLTELLLHWAVTLLRCYFTELWSTELLLSYFTEVLLYWTVTLLSCYLTELLRDWTVTEPLLYWTVTWLSC